MFIYKENKLIREVDFLFITEEFEGGSSRLNRGRKIGLPEENVGQVSSKHNGYQVNFI